MRTLLPRLAGAAILCAFTVWAPVARAGGFKLQVGSKALKPADTPSHLSGSVRNLESGIMRWNDPHFDPQHAGSTPAFEIHPVGATRITLVKGIDYSKQYQIEGRAIYKVSGLGPDNKLSITALMPVSGHVGNGPARVAGEKFGQWDILSDKNATAVRYAKTNRYNILVTHVETGQQQQLSNIESTGLVTAHQLDIDMSEKGTYRVQFWPQGSAMVGGYTAGRTIDLVRE
jgi:hypothetical protein